MSDKIKLAQGAGGEMMDKLIKKHILKYFGKSSESAEIPLSMLDDSAVIDDIVFTTDSHTVSPIIFPGGDLGSLAVAGTVNDVAVMGAKPIALSAGFIIEEGLPSETFEIIVKSMSKVASNAGVPIVTGDTKVVERGAIQQFMINTSGIGKRTSILEKNIEVVKKYRSFKQRWLLDSNLENPILYKSSLRLEFTDLSQVSKGSVILKSQENTIAARMIADEWHISYNADGTFICSGPVRTLQDTYYDMTIKGERKYVANNWSMWEAVGELDGENQEKYSLRFIVTGDDRFSATSPKLTFTIVIPTGNAYEQESSSYIPEKPTVFRETMVSWVNHDSVTHTVQSQDGNGNIIPLFNSDVLQPGEVFEYEFSEPGTYHYLCTLHPWRSGIITVV